MKKENPQSRFWQRKFGKDYTLRNSYSPQEFDRFYLKTWGVTRTTLNKKFLGKLSRDIKILEIGCNIGLQLRHLQLAGFKNLYGIELQQDAVEKAKSSTRGINIICGSAFDVPFADGWFDLVFTSGVLIHLHPKNLKQAISEIHRCSRTWIWGFEYFAPTLQEIIYRGHRKVLWKQDFCKLYVATFPDLKVVKEEKIKYRNDANLDQMFLLRKKP